MGETINRLKDLKDTTPMMKQYLQVKEEYSDYILMYRLGDFYECFFDDALIASRELELTLTSRDCGCSNRAAMCGVPYHKSDVYIGKLVERGYKVAVCEQTEDPKKATGLVKREVTRVITPGTVTDSSLLPEGKNNFLCAVCFGTDIISFALADITTGEVHVTKMSGDDKYIKLTNELGAYQPAEILLNVKLQDCPELTGFLKDRFTTLVNDNQTGLFSFERAKDRVREVFKSEAEKLTEAEEIMSVGALLSYIQQTQKTDMTFAEYINVYSSEQYLGIDLNTRRNLELTETMRNKEKRGTLLWVLDKTKTAMGARLLRSWILKPLVNLPEITRRHTATEALLSNVRIRDELRELLSSFLDIERLTAKAVYGSANARDMRAIQQSIAKLPAIKAIINQLNCDFISTISERFDTLADVAALLDEAIVENPPLTIREGDIIRDGFNADVDYYRNIKNNGVDIMRSIEEREKELTNIRTLKVDYNKVFGYYIEVSKSFINDVPDRYIRKQTLTNCERYITQELKEMETTIFTADDKLVNLEYEIFNTIRNYISENNERIRHMASLIAQLDVFASFAEVADKNGYVRPEMDYSAEIIIKDGRHPVVEKFVTDSYFVPNDTKLDTNHNRMMIITGPNMAGKSTYMRQVAIITIMAQIGSFVPAKEAKLGIVDKVFTRVGASDDLASGQSTFMLEMSEVAAILKNATKNSLIIYDEVGRGTSTYDGMSIARAVVEYTHSKKIGAKTMFATHYHELTDMEEQYDGIVNYNIAAKKRQDSVIFLRKIVRGGTDDSYGIEVAKLAGVPAEVTKRAKEILNEILSQIETGVSPKSAKKKPDENSMPDIFSAIAYSKDTECADKIRALDLNTITPIEAMNMLFELKKLVE